MSDPAALSILFPAVVAGVLGGLAHLLWWPAPKVQRGLALSWHFLVVLVVLLVASSDVFSRAPVQVFLTAPVLGLLSWQVGRYQVRSRLRSALLVATCLLPGGFLLTLVLPPDGVRDPVQWLWQPASSGTGLLVWGHLLGTVLPLVATALDLRTAPRSTSWRDAARVLVGVIVGPGALWLGSSLVAHPVRIRLLVACSAPILVALLAWSVRGRDGWRPRADPATRVALATAMARVLQGTTNRLGSELALAASHARTLSNEVPTRLTGPINDLLVVLQRGQDMAGSLGRFADTQAPSRAVVDVGTAVERAIARVQRELGGEFSIAARPRDARVWTDALSLERSLSALLRNAIQAQTIQESDGAVQITLTEQTPAERSTGLVAGSLSRQQYLVIEIQDAGDGMTPNTLERCLEPFFSTRENQDGLGLLAPLGLVRTEGAALALTSGSRGSRATLWVPRGAHAATTGNDQWAWSLVGTAGTSRDVILLGSADLQVEMYGLFLDAREVSWSLLTDVADLTTGQIAPRTDGVLLLLYTPTDAELSDLARWLLPRFVRIVAPPAMVAALVNRGIDPDQVFAYDNLRTRTVVSTVIAALTPPLAEEG